MRIGLTKKLLTLTLMIMMMCMSLSVYVQTLDDELLLINPFATEYSEGFISDEFNDGIIDTKWDLYLNMHNGDSIMFINDVNDTQYVIQQGDADIVEENGYIYLSDPSNLYQYEELINNDYQRYTRIDYDCAGIYRNFVGIDFESVIFRNQHLNYDPNEETNFMNGHNYCSLVFIDKSYINEDEVHIYRYQIKIANEANDHYNIFMRAWLHIYDKYGNLTSWTILAYREYTFQTVSDINNLEYIDFSFIKESETSLNLKATFSDDNVYQYSIPFDAENYYLTQIFDYISPYNPDPTPPYNTNMYPGDIKKDYIRYYPDTENADTSWFVVEHPKLLYACVDTTFNITVKDGRRNLFPVENARITISDGGRILYEGTTDYLGICAVTDFYY
ncbi:hypothetical protein KAU15_06465, partial [candidate division WOR-3 bacterium]|nr:hypothetical protein [candidate division WOR-3 bacterium]